MCCARPGIPEPRRRRPAGDDPATVRAERRVEDRAEVAAELRSGSPVRASQMRASPSLLAVTTREPSRDTSTESTSSVWPVSVTLPPRRSGTSRPSRSHAGRRLAAVARVERAGVRCGSCGNPRPHRAVVAGSREPVARAKKARSRCRCGRGNGSRPAGLDLPRPGGPVAARGQDRVLVGAEARPADLVPCSGMIETRLPEVRSQTRAVPSLLAATSRRESGLKPTSKRRPSWPPSKVRSSRPTRSRRSRRRRRRQSRCDGCSD